VWDLEERALELDPATEFVDLPGYAIFLAFLAKITHKFSRSVEQESEVRPRREDPRIRVESFGHYPSAPWQETARFMIKKDDHRRARKNGRSIIAPR
jgi:hypothetical protein